MLTMPLKILSKILQLIDVKHRRMLVINLHLATAEKKCRLKTRVTAAYDNKRETHAMLELATSC